MSTMIKANELRVGNLVINSHGEIQRVFNINDDGMRIHHKVTVDYNVEPIPLTPEILKACEFEKKSLGSEACYSMPFVRPMTADKTPGHDILLVDFGITDNKYSGKYAVAIREHDRNIQFGISIVDSLHQLQNLYFALTLTELQVNL